MLRHLPNKALDTNKETLIYSKMPVVIPNGNDRRSNTADSLADRTKSRN